MGIIPLLRPIDVPPNALHIQMPLMLGLSVALLPLIKYQRGVKRYSGIILLAIYVAFTFYMYKLYGPEVN